MDVRPSRAEANFRYVSDSLACLVFRAFDDHGKRVGAFPIAEDPIGFIRMSAKHIRLARGESGQKPEGGEHGDGRLAFGNGEDLHSGLAWLLAEDSGQSWGARLRPPRSRRQSDGQRAPGQSPARSPAAPDWRALHAALPCFPT